MFSGTLCPATTARGFRASSFSRVLGAETHPPHQAAGSHCTASRELIPLRRRV